MSAVYRAYDTVMGRDVALKRLLPVEETNLNESAGEALSREAAALARFSHPNVVTVFAFEEDAEGPYVVMELVEGEDLHAIMKSGALSWDDFRDVAAQCLDPLVAAAELSLLHRDIKPGNLMLTVTASGRFLVKLLDFGLSKFSQQPSLQTLDQRGTFLGSIDFIAPEQLELRPLDQRTDLYSLGCVFYYMLTQESPFAGSNPAETSMNHLKHRCLPVAERRPDVPPLVADWIMRLVSRDPEDRPADAREALRQYQDALAGVPHALPRDPRPARDGIPFAKIADTPATGPAKPPEEEPAAAPPAAPGKRVLRAASGPVAADRRTTGPQRPPLAGPQRSGATGPRRPRPTAPASPDRRGPAAPPRWRELPWRWIGAGAGGAVLLLLLAVLLPASRPGRPLAEDAAAAEPSSPAPSLPPLAYPATLPQDQSRPAPPALPVGDGLYARFVSTHGVLGRDYARAPAPGESVAAWRNLAFPETARSLLRDAADPSGAHLPILRDYGGGEAPGLARRIPGLATTNRTALSMSRHQGVLPKGFTLFAVMRIEAGDDRLFRILPPVPDGRSFTVATGYDGKVAAVCKATADGPEVRTAIPWESGSTGVLVCVFDPAANEQTISARPAAGAAPPPAKGGVAFQGAAFGAVAIGKRGFGDSYDTATGNVYFEFALYDRVLSEAERRAVSDALAKRYFGAAE